MRYLFLFFAALTASAAPGNLFPTINVTYTNFFSVIDPASTLKPGFTNFHKRYVNPTTGNDATAVVDDNTKPYKYLATAVAAASAGDTFILAAGTNFCTNELVFPKNCAVYGASRAGTIIRNFPDPDSAASYMFRPSDNLFVQDCTLECGLWDKPLSYYQTDPIYNDQSYAVVAAFGSDTGSFTNSICNNVEMHGRDDVVQLNQVTACEGKFYNTFMNGHYDHIFYRSSTAHNLKFYGLTVVSTSAAILNLFAGGSVTGTLTINGANVRFYDSVAGGGKMILGSLDTSGTYNFTNVIFTTTCTTPITSISPNCHFSGVVLNNTNLITIP